jgi:branched-chain amino acid transport system substrate-binding protein
MKQMASIKNQQMPMMLPGIKWNTSAEDFFLIESAQLARFDGKEWALFGDVIGN